MRKPHHTLLFLLAVGLGSFLLAAVFPSEGITITEDFKLQFVTLSELMEEDKDSLPVVDVAELLESYEKMEMIDSTAIKDSIRSAEMARRKAMLRIQYGDSAAVHLPRFFAGLDRMQSKAQRKVRIIHYGDSQIEGDRISSLIRDRLQKEFGGNGPGYIPVKNVVATSAISMEISGNWLRYPVFGKADSTLNHNHFGIYGAFCRFTPIIIPPGPDSTAQVARKPASEASSELAEDKLPIAIGSAKADSTQPPASGASDSLLAKQETSSGQEDDFIPSDTSKSESHRVIHEQPTDTTRAWVKISPSSYSYLTARQYDLLEMLYRNPDAPFVLKVYLNDSLIRTERFEKHARAQYFSHRFERTPKKLRLEFEAITSPDIYGLRLESSQGLILDNVGLRGSSGTFFGKINSAEMATQFGRQPVRLIVMQFGGNSVPYIADKKRAARYGRWFKAQIEKLQALNPGADIVVIGPSDMSVKEKTDYVTYKQLPWVRDALKQAAFDAGAGFWDIYEVMGGRNSMPQWVEAEPALAASDYTHFTRKGANKIAGLFVDALLKDYAVYKNGGKEPEEEKKDALLTEN